MSILRILAIAVITLCTAAAWFVLGSAITVRTDNSGAQLGGEVTDVWGPALAQKHPAAFILPSTGTGKRLEIKPSRSEVKISLHYEPKKRGLLWHRTYGVEFSADYEFANPTPIAQTVYVQLPLPAKNTSYTNFSFTLGDAAPRQTAPADGTITEAVLVPAKGTVPLHVAYASRGMDSWRYLFPDASRVRQFELSMTTDFDEINFPQGTGSPTSRKTVERLFTWSYPDVLSAPAIGMDMPKVLNAGPVASRISFFAPVSLVFFFAVLLIVGMIRGVNLHPMNYFLLAAGCFAFQLLFAYLVDLLPIQASFGIASAVSLVLVCGYIGITAGRRLFWIALPAQLAYMVLFSYSFFFDGLTGLTITIGAIMTLAMLMLLTARMDWEKTFRDGVSPWRKKVTA